MRDQSNLINAFIPLHEKKWEASLFSDKAIKSSVEYHLETLARALSGRTQLIIRMAEKDRPFEQVNHIQSDDGNWIVKTEKYKWMCKIDEFRVYGINKIQLWLNVIDFWAGRTIKFPCGGASTRSRYEGRAIEALEAAKYWIGKQHDFRGEDPPVELIERALKELGV